MAKPKPGTVALGGGPRARQFRGAKTDAGRLVVLTSEGHQADKKGAPEAHRRSVERAELGSRAADALNGRSS